MRCEDQQLRSPPRESASLSARPCAEINARYDAFERGNCTVFRAYQIALAIVKQSAFRAHNAVHLLLSPVLVSGTLYHKGGQTLPKKRNFFGPAGDSRPPCSRLVNTHSKAARISLRRRTLTQPSVVIGAWFPATESGCPDGPESQVLPGIQAAC